MQRMCLALHYTKEIEKLKKYSFYNNSVILYNSLYRHIIKNKFKNLNIIKFK